MFACSRQTDIFEDDLSYRYEQGMEYFDSEKYSKAETEFTLIIQNNPGSSLALEAQYYLAESIYFQDRFAEAEVEFDRYIRFSNDSQRIEKARFRSCECAFMSANEYLFDQGYSAEILDKLQFFIEEYPQSIFGEEIISYMHNVRKRLARKEYETARLYLKLKEFESARIYFQNVVDNYYDTEFADEARISIIFSYLLDGDKKSAHDSFTSQKNKFTTEEKKYIAESLIEELENGKMSLAHYIRLYK